MSQTASSAKIDPLGITIWIIGSLLGKTWRIKTHFPESIDPYHDIGHSRMYCFWHSQLLPLSYIFRSTHKTALVSKSRDGQLAAAMARLWGHDVVFGSSSRGGMSGLRQCVRVLESKKCVVMTPDGPRGPKEFVKPGVAQIALLSGAQVLPVSAIPNRAWRLKSWDSFVIPKPFTKINVVIGEPLICCDSGEKSVENLRDLIQKRMDLNNASLA